MVALQRELELRDALKNFLNDEEENFERELLISELEHELRNFQNLLHENKADKRYV